VIERVKLEETAQEAALLAESERLHTALFNSLSHELRTPLASIIGSVSTLMEADAVYSPDQKMQLLDEIRGGSRRLERLVANLLDTARLESGMMELKSESVDVEDIVGTALRHMADPLKPFKVQFSIPPDLPFIEGDSVLLELVLVNLIDNALKSSPPGRTLFISALESEGKIRISVADEGSGISDADLVRIFDKFYSLRRKESETGGTGLGLSICKAVVELHGGTIWAENKKGGGAMIHFTIPRAPESHRRIIPREGGDDNE